MGNQRRITKELAKMEATNAATKTVKIDDMDKREYYLREAMKAAEARGDKKAAMEFAIALKQEGYGNKLNVSDFEISKAYADAVNSGLRGNKAFATAAHKLSISTEDVLNARDRMCNPVTPEAKREEGSRLYGSKGK